MEEEVSDPKCSRHLIHEQPLIECDDNNESTVYTATCTTNSSAEARAQAIHHVLIKPAGIIIVTQGHIIASDNGMSGAHAMLSVRRAEVRGGDMDLGVPVNH